MILSAQQLFSDAQNAAASGTVVSTNTIDLFPVGAVRNAPAGVSLIRDVGPGQPVAIVVCATSPAASTIKVDIIQSANANLSAPDILESSGVTRTYEEFGVISCVGVHSESIFSSTFALA